MSPRITAIFIAALALTASSAAFANPSNDPLAIRAEAPSNRYGEVRLGVGLGGTSSGVRVNDGNLPLAAFNTSFVYRSNLLVLGANLSLQEKFFGGNHAFYGGLIGVAIGSDAEAHLELLAEAGVDSLSNVGDGLLSDSLGDTSATIPYVGSQIRTVFDIGGAGGLQIDVSVHARADLWTEERTLLVDGELQTWKVGGVTANVIGGLSYQFR